MAVVLFWLAPTIGQREIAFAASLALALPLLAMLLVSLRTPKLSVVRRFSPETASAGINCAVTLSVQNWGLAPTPDASWIDDAASPMQASPPAELTSLPAFRALETGTPRIKTLRYLLPTPVRGVHAVGPFTVVLSDPFALFIRRIQIGGTDNLIVTPAIEKLARGSIRLPNGDGQSLQSRRPAGSGEHDVIARKYQTGDSIRRVHWPATAKYSELMVRQDDQHNDHEAVVMIDDRGSGYGPDEGRGLFSAKESSHHFEWAVSMATSIAVHLVEEGYRTRFISASGTANEDSPGDSRELLLRGALIRRAVDMPSLSVPAIVPDVGRVAGELPPVFAVLGHVDPESVESLRRAASGSSSAVAFIVTQTGEQAADWALSLRAELDRAGWSVRICDDSVSPAEAWASLGATEGAW